MSADAPALARLSVDDSRLGLGAGALLAPLASALAANAHLRVFKCVAASDGGSARAFAVTLLAAVQANA